MSIKAFIDKHASFGAATITPTVALATIEEADMPHATLEALQVELATAIQEKVELSTAKTTLEASMVKAKADKEAAEAWAATLKQELETFKLETQDSTRKAALSAVLAEDQVDAMMLATKALDTDAFTTVLGSLQSKAALEAETFKEIGYQGAEATAADPLDRIIEAEKSKSKGNK